VDHEKDKVVVQELQEEVRKSSASCYWVQRMGELPAAFASWLDTRDLVEIEGVETA